MDMEARLAQLEQKYGEIMRRLKSQDEALAHLDKCVDATKQQAEVNAEAARLNADLWDHRWQVVTKYWGRAKLGLAALIGAAFVAGSGPGSLKGLLDLLAKLAH